MTSDYRIVENILDGDVFYTIHEVYYHSNGKIENWDGAPEVPFGSTRLELSDNLKKMQAALKKPVLRKWTGKNLILRLKEI